MSKKSAPKTTSSKAKKLSVKDLKKVKGGYDASAMEGKNVLSYNEAK